MLKSSFGFQASILAHKKETLANSLRDKKEEALTIQKDLDLKRQQLENLGGQVLKGDDVSFAETFAILLFPHTYKTSETGSNE